MNKTAQAGNDSVNDTNQPVSTTTDATQNTMTADPMASTNKPVDDTGTVSSEPTSKKQEELAGSQGKEFEPISPQKEPEAKLPDAERYEVPKELEAHVEVAEEKIEIPKELKKHGIENASQEQQPAVNVAISHPPLPMTDDQIGNALKTKQSSSIRWLAEWCVKQLKVMHIQLKKVQGHFVEVKDN